MRIAKLSKDNFPTKKVEEFFRDDLPELRGKFRITKGRIAQDGLEPGEKILFSYEGRIRFIAKSATGHLKNEDEDQEDYPFYFLVNMDTLGSIDISLQDVEQWYHQETGETKSLIQTQGWPKIENEPFATNLWACLKGKQVKLS